MTAQALAQEISILNHSIHNAQFHVVASGMGQVSQGDIETARDCKGILVTFNTKTPSCCVISASLADRLQKVVKSMHVFTVSDTIIYSLFATVPAGWGSDS